MAYIHTATQRYPLSPKQIKLENPNTSFPEPFIPTDDYETVVTVTRPAFDPITQKLVEQPPVRVDGVWTQQWAVEMVSAEEAAANQIAKNASVKASIIQQTQARLDVFAMTRNYDNILSACSYSTSPTLKFSTEGQYCVAQRDATWAKLLEIMDEVTAGTRPVPSGYAEIEPELPPLVWPI